MTTLAGPLADARTAAASRRDLLMLARPRLAAMGLLTVVLTYAIASPSTGDWYRVAHLVVGSLLTLAGASVLNQLAERRVDGLMRRTANRPLPAGRMRPRNALVYGVVLATLGLVLLAVAVNGLTAWSAAAGLGAYILLYTPLKRRTSLATVVGAVPGAAPVLMGWSAATGSLGIEAWVLFGTLFLWQLTHFLAIGWMYRTDYLRAGFRMLPAVDPEGAATARQAVVYGLALIPVSLGPSALGLAGPVYFVGALALGAAYLAAGIGLARHRTGASAARLLRASVLYLPLLLSLLLIDRGVPR